MLTINISGKDTCCIGTGIPSNLSSYKMFWNWVTLYPVLRGKDSWSLDISAGGLVSALLVKVQKITALPKTRKSRFGGFLNMIGMADSPDTANSCMNIRVSEGNGQAAKAICSSNLCTTFFGHRVGTKMWIPATSLEEGYQSLPGYKMMWMLNKRMTQQLKALFRRSYFGHIFDMD
ncbi:unnamed protein product [Fraxinus pennsylvanica]|uniref:Uncharacterized protein n=1 Tax=Fraxinus pennsylvanica TaxID=56036 RepID=A0AAD2DLR6_9LAMI|nr:unnamed protein product [Fraxinus pennsylvanica]